MGDLVVTGTAPMQTLETIHDKVAEVYDKQLDRLLLYEELDKDDIALLKGAVSFLKDNDVKVKMDKTNHVQKVKTLLQKS